MNNRQLIHGATPTLKAGDEVLTPTGRIAYVEGVDLARGEVLVRWPSETAAFKPGHLRRADTREGGGLVFLPPIQEPAASADDATGETR